MYPYSLDPSASHDPYCLGQAGLDPLQLPDPTLVDWPPEDDYRQFQDLEQFCQKASAAHHAGSGFERGVRDNKGFVESDGSNEPPAMEPAVKLSEKATCSLTDTESQLGHSECADSAGYERIDRGPMEGTTLLDVELEENSARVSKEWNALRDTAEVLQSNRR